MAENEAAVKQTEDHLEEAVPHTEVATTVSDIPVDYGNPGMADFPDPVFDEVDDDEDETPSEGEPKDDDGELDDDDEMDEDEVPVVPPGIEPDQQYDHDPED